MGFLATAWVHFHRLLSTDFLGIRRKEERERERETGDWKCVLVRRQERAEFKQCSSRDGLINRFQNFFLISALREKEREKEGEADLSNQCMSSLSN